MWCCSVGTQAIPNHHWFQAAEDGQDEEVARMLAETPSLIDTTTIVGWNALHFAVNAGHTKVVERLLTASPRLAHAVNSSGCTPLHYAGDSEVVERLLMVGSPDLIHKPDRRGRTPLHYASLTGRDEVVARLLAGSRDFGVNGDNEGCTPLHCAVMNGHENVVEKLLASKPELIYAVDRANNTVLHVAGLNQQSSPMIVRLWRTNPNALRAVNASAQTPLRVAIRAGNAPAIDALLGGLSFDEILSTFTECGFVVASAAGGSVDFEERIRHFMDQQCECVARLLNRDVAGTISGYLGLDHRRPTKIQRTC